MENDFSCIEYDEFIKNFQFIICSRYHGIVHAYRNGVPAIVLGWAVKYKELTESVSQNQYMFDIVDGMIEDFKVKEMVDNMLTNYSEESQIIRGRVEEIQKDNCFEVLNKYIS
ncbi:MAG: polysaccharide pyruvyl transferase family protein [Lachnospiraceae bacterium]|nr:polysaccharide pyruvyl transferase family protein [Lachnospiraceae bacterium]